MRRFALACSLALGTAWLPFSPTAQAAHGTPAAADTAVLNPTNTVSGAAIVQTALRYVGYRYTTVGNTPQTGFSCIGLVSYVYQRNGITLPDELHAALAYAPPVSFNSLQPGDILFFQNTVWTGLSHTAIYLGGGRFVHAEWYNRGVRISSFYGDPVDGDYWISKYLSANRPWQGPPGGPVALPPLSPPLSSIATPTPTAGSTAGTSTATINVDALNVRSGPGRTSAIEETAPRGTVLSILGRHGGWYEVQTPDGTVGWVVVAGVSISGHSAPATPSPTATPTLTPSLSTQQSVPPRPAQHAQVTLAIPWLRVHNAPGLSAPVVGYALHGQRLELLQRSGAWEKVRLPDGTVGWVSAPLLFQKVTTTHPAAPAPGRTATGTQTPGSSGMVRSAVRVHRAPLISAPVLTVAPAGIKVRILARQGIWLRIQLPNGIRGYVISRAVRG